MKELPICFRASSPFAQEETSIETSELKIVKSLYICYCLVPKLMYLRTSTSEKAICRRLFQHHLVGSLGFSITDAVMNYTESHTHEDLKLLKDLRLLIVAILTVIFCLFAHLNNVIMFYEFSTLYKENE
jgi:hypothetical protein